MIESVNWIAIAVAVVASMIIGAAWFGLFAKPWMKAAALSPDEIARVEGNENPGKYGIAVLTHIIMAWVLSGVIGHAGEMTLANGMLTAFLCWAGFIVTTITVTDRFQLRSWNLTLIDCGHYLLVLLAQGAIIGWFGTS
jgi:hypothetical protein